MLAVLAVVWLSPWVLAKFYVNLGLLTALKAPACDPQWFVCRVLPAPYPALQFDGNQVPLRQAEIWLRRALALNPRSSATRLHLAEIAFALGDRQAAARYLDAIPVKDSRPSPLRLESRYEARLVRARQAAQAGQWQTAVYNYRLGLAWGDERTLPVDEQEYFMAQAEVTREQLDHTPANRVLAYQLGRYLAQAGDWEQATQYLALSANRAGLTARQRATALYLLAQDEELHGDPAIAIVHYQRALQVDPTYRQAYFRLLLLLRQAGQVDVASGIEQQLGALGPTYRLGIQGQDYLAEQPITLANGWTLVGYELDEEMLEQTKSLELILWWRGEGKTPTRGGFVSLGEYWLQAQTVKNLAPNAGFEWGVDERGIPLGWDREFYGAPEGSVLIGGVKRQGRGTQVLVTNNSPKITNIGLASRMLPIDSSILYLMSGWIWAENMPGSLGRNCKTGSQLTITPFYLTTYWPGQPSQVWIDASQASTAYLDLNVEQCEIVAINDANSEKPVSWDNFLFAHLVAP